jgi:uncharacterized repeat protein (TIGR02543 family)
LAASFAATALPAANVQAAPEAGAAQTEADYLADTYGLPADHVFENVTVERLSFLLGGTATNSNNANTDPAYDNDGNYAIVFGGPENASSRAAIPLIDEVAKEYGVETVYHFDPKIDGDKLDITDSAAITPATLQTTLDALWTNATRGIKARLKTLDAGYDSSATYLFVYSKNHTVPGENPGDPDVSHPIVADLLSKAASFGDTQASIFKGKVADVFEAAGVDPVTNKADIKVYPFFDYFKTRINTTVGTSSTYTNVWIPESAREGFTIQTVTYPQLLHILETPGDYAIFLGGTWCPYTSPTDNIANTAAVQAGVKKVYQFDLRLDGASSNSNLKTALKSSDPDVGVEEDGSTTYEGGILYGRLLEKLANIELEPGINHYLYYPNGDTSTPLSTEQKLSAKNIGVPFLFEYNKDNVDENGNPAPVVSEWIGYKPLTGDLYAYAWYTKNNVVSYTADAGYFQKQARNLGGGVSLPAGTPVNPDREDTEGNGNVSATLALPGLFTFFQGITDNRTAADPWATVPGSKPVDTSVPDPSGGCGASAKDISYDKEDPILGQNGNAGYDVQDYDIQVAYKEGLSATPDALRGNIHAITTVTATATANLSEIAFDFRVPAYLYGVKVNGEAIPATEISYVDDDTTDTHKIKVTPYAGGVPAAIASGSTFTVEFEYVENTGSYKFLGGSTHGLIPSATSKGATALGEPNGPTFWSPSNNNTTDRATYTITLTAPRNLTGVSVGNLVSKQAHGTDITRVWEQTQPTIPYLVFASFGEYIEFEQEITLTDGTVIPSYSYVAESLYNSTSNKRKAYWFAKDLGEYIRWAEGRFGKYPGETAGFVFESLKDGANTVGYSLETVGRPYYSGIPDTPTFVHEQLHQWFGDSVTIAKWEDLWLNEGFASFLSNIWFEDNDTKSETTNDWYAKWFKENKENDFWQIAPADPINAANLFTDVTYGRGSYALAALRAAVGDDDFFNIIRTWASEQAGKAATTEQFIETAKRVSSVDDEQLDELLYIYLYQQNKPNSFPDERLPEPTLKPGDVITPTVVADGGSGADFGTLKVGHAIGTLPTPTRAGYTFEGWYVDGVKIDASYVIPAKNITITAKWVANSDSGANTDPGSADNGGNEQAAPVSIKAAKVAAIANQAYTGTAIKPAVTVTLAGKTLKSGTDYTVAYKANKAIGKASVTLTGKGGYTGTLAATFKIVPKKVTLKSVKAGSKKLTAKWAKLSGTTKYQVRYKLSTAKKWKTLTVSATSSSKAIAKLKAGKKYQLQVRAYKTVAKVKYVGAWSKAKTAKPKK